MEIQRLRHWASLLGDEAGRQRLSSGLRRRVKQGAQKLRRPTATKVDLPDFELPDGPVARPDLRVAVILDPFSELGFRYEWQQITITPENWLEVLGQEPPDLLFVESAWNGNDGAWRLAMTGSDAPTTPLRELVQWCRDAGIPTVFWNKEDPPNYDKFIDTAKLFDQVFTVDADKLETYRRDLGHNRVDLLPFAAQPRIHNPIRRDKAGSIRPHDVAFAGTYFADKHAERRAQMDMVLEPARRYGLHIYSRLQGDDQRYRFPKRFAGHIVGSVPYDRMLAAYTAYKVFLNVNSVTRSPTMCARRLFELSAAQTAVVSAPAASVEGFFGNDIAVVDSVDAAQEAIHNLISHKELRDRQALRAHRRVFDAHLTGHRVDHVLSTLGLPVTTPDLSVSAVVPTMRPDNLENIWQFMHRQSHDQVELVLITHGFTVGAEEQARLQSSWPLPNLVVVPADASLLLGDLMNLGVQAASGRYVAKMDDDNYYAPHYLRDLVRAFSWTDAQVVGKWAHYVHVGDDTGPTLLRFAQHEHRYVRLVQGGTIVTPRQVALDFRFESLPRRVDTTFLDKIRAAKGQIYASDRFNFISTRQQDTSGHTWGVSVGHLLTHSSTLEFYGPAEAHVTC